MKYTYDFISRKYLYLSYVLIKYQLLDSEFLDYRQDCLFCNLSLFADKWTSSAVRIQITKCNKKLVQIQKINWCMKDMSVWLEYRFASTIINEYDRVNNMCSQNWKKY